MCYLKLFVCSLLFCTITAAPIEQNISIFQRYQQTLINPKILPFLSECLPKTTGKASEIFCNSYFDMLHHLNQDPTAQEILEAQSFYTREDVVKGFCADFNKMVPKTSNVTTYQKYVEQFYELIVAQDNCKTFCIEFDSDLKNTIKQKCVLLSYGHNVIRNSVVTKPLLDDKTKLVTSPSNDSPNVQKIDTNSIVQPEISSKLREELYKEIDSKIKDVEQSKILVPNPKVPEVQLPINKVTVEPQIVLSSEDRKPINTIISSSEKTEKKILVEPPTEDLESIPNPGNDSKLPEQTLFDPNETEEKDVKLDEPVVTEENPDENPNLDEVGNKNVFENALDGAENNNDVDPDDDDSAGDVPPESEVFDDKKQFQGIKRPSDIQHKDDYVFAANPKENVDPFFSNGDSNFFTYFMLLMLLCIIMYVGYHNKSKILALVLEGRRGSNSRGGGRRKHTAAYRKLDSNLEEAITSGASSRASQIIY